MKRRLSILIFALGAMIVVNAQEIGQSFSLKEAVDYALSNNKTLKATRFDVQSSESAYKETRASWMPQVEGTVDYYNYFGYEMEFSLGEGMPASVSEMSNQSTAKFQVGQLLFSGQLLVGLRAARLGVEMSKKNIESSELDTKALVTEAYYNVLVTAKSLEIVNQNLVNMQELVAKTNSMYKAGVVELTDVDQLRVQLNTLKNSQLSLDRTVQITYNLLRFHLGLSVNSPITLTDDLQVFMGDDNIVAETAQTLDLNNNISYQLMEKQVELNTEMVDNEKWAFAPTVSSFYVYNAKILTTSFDMTPNHTAGVTMTIPIFSSGARKHKLDQAKIALEQTKVNQDLMKDQLYLQEVQLRYDFQSKYEQYMNQKQNVDVAKRVYASYENKFAQGVASSMDLTQANSNYLKAESDYLTSMLDLLKSKVAFDKLLNTL